MDYEIHSGERYCFSQPMGQNSTRTDFKDCGFKGAQKKSLLEKMTVKRKPGGKNNSGKKAWCVLKNIGKKPGVSYFLI